jgi:uncharacterized protein YdiU (UPF0061 family)
MSQLYHSLDDLKFDNSFVNTLPADPIEDNYCRQVSSASFSNVKPKPSCAPRLISFSAEMAEALNLHESVCSTKTFTEVFSGNKVLSEMHPCATVYGGHQFGNWAGQLGDGRAINLGEVVTAGNTRWTLQLKGAGPTPYSRTADGLAVLRSSIREYICSEAMYHLGVPTTRALSICLTGEEVERDMFYDGNPKKELGAVVCRTAPSFIRFGHFQLPAAMQNYNLLRELINYTIRYDFHDMSLPMDSAKQFSNESILEWFEEVCKRTALMVVEWMRVGFVHGVMNTDNMSILGLTIDYGPYGWLEDYDPNWTPNTTDANGRRYRYGNQPQVALWNLVQLANALYPLIKESSPLENALKSYQETYDQHNQSMLASKLGLKEFVTKTDGKLTEDLFQLLSEVETDMTIFFRKLALVQKTPNFSDEEIAYKILLPAYYKPEENSNQYKADLNIWLKSYNRRLQDERSTADERQSAMDQVNPNFVFRNYLAQLAIDEASIGNFQPVNDLLSVLKKPYTNDENNHEYAQKRPEWARHRPGCSMLSCSS